MKLIDIEDEMLLKNLFNGGLSAKQVTKLFMKQPQIEAIPISFIKKIIEDNRKQAIWEVRYLDDYEKHYARDKVNILKDLLELWEKEND